MSRYRKVEVKVWADEAFRALSPLRASGQALWLYLLTCPESLPIPGVIVAGRMGIAESLGWEVEETDRAFAEVFPESFAEQFPERFAEWFPERFPEGSFEGSPEGSSGVSKAGFGKVDFRARLIFLPKAIAKNPPENPNVVRSWGKAWDLVPECPLKREILEAIRLSVESRGAGFLRAFEDSFLDGSENGSRNGFPNGSRNGMANQEQEQEQDLREEPPTPYGDDEGDEGTDEVKAKRAESDARVLALVDAWNAQAAACGLPKVNRDRFLVSGGRRVRAARARCQDRSWLASYPEALARIPQSNFLLGRDERGREKVGEWRANLEWFVRPETVEAILEGAKYGTTKESSTVKGGATEIDAETRRRLEEMRSLAERGSA